MIKTPEEIIAEGQALASGTPVQQIIQLCMSEAAQAWQQLQRGNRAVIELRTFDRDDRRQAALELMAKGWTVEFQGRTGETIAIGKL